MLGKELSGRELDLEVARRVFGFRWFHCVGANAVERNQFFSPETAETWRELNWTLIEIDGPQDDQFNDDTAAPRFSESIEAAMQVAEKMRERGYRWNAQTPHGKGWEVYCYREDKRGRGDKSKGLLPEAICRGALAAIENKQ